MSQLSEEEVNTAIKNVEKLFVKASCTPVCQDHQEAVMTCYQDHPRQALRCARQVEDFARCVDLSRLVSFVGELSVCFSFNICKFTVLEHKLILNL